MGWNENIKRILDFIPVFERDSKRMVEQLAASREACQAAINKSELLENQNKVIIERLERLESVPVQEVEPYNDSELKEAFAQIIERIQAIKPFDDSKLKEEVRKVNEVIVSIKPYDDSAINESVSSLVKRLDSTKGYDDTGIKNAVTKLTERLTSTQQSIGLTIKGINKDISNIKPYNDQELREEIKRFNLLFDSFRRTEGEQAATAISNITKKVREISLAVDAIKPYDDTALIEKVESIKPFDDAKLKESIKKIAGGLSKIEPYNDSQIKEELSSISQFIDDLEPFNDSQLKEAIGEIAGQVKSIDRYDDSKLVEMIESIKPYNDAQVKKSIKLLGDKIKAIKPYSDAGIKNQLNDLTKKTVKMINDHKGANSKHNQELLKDVEQRIEQIKSEISKVSDSIPEAYEDKQISDRIKKHGETLTELSGEVSKIKQLFEVD